jgi:hypothetical protein
MPRPAWLSLFAVVLLSVTLAAAIQTTGGLVDGHPPVTKGKILILSVPDGKERGGGKVVGGSGAKIASAIRDDLVARHFVPFTSDHESLADGVKEARDLAYEFVLKARITEWEDNATEWSGKPDSAALSLELYDLTPALVSTASHRKKGSVMAMTSNSPDRFVQEIVKLSLDRLFGSSQIGKSNAPRAYR